MSLLYPQRDGVATLHPFPEFPQGRHTSFGDVSLWSGWGGGLLLCLLSAGTPTSGLWEIGTLRLRAGRFSCSSLPVDKGRRAEPPAWRFPAVPGGPECQFWAPQASELLHSRRKSQAKVGLSTLEAYVCFNYSNSFCKSSTPKMARRKLAFYAYVSESHLPAGRTRVWCHHLSVLRMCHACPARRRRTLLYLWSIGLIERPLASASTLWFLRAKTDRLYKPCAGVGAPLFFRRGECASRRLVSCFSFCCGLRLILLCSDFVSLQHPKTLGVAMGRRPARW